MRKFLFFTDSHFRDDQPQCRKDDIYHTQLVKLGKLLEYVVEYNVDAILHGGDFFNTKKPPHRLVVDIINWGKQVRVPIYSIIGNHDVTGYNLDSVSNSGLGVLFEADVLRKIEGVEIFEDDKIAIKAAHTSLTFKDEYMFDKQYADFTKIILSHNYIIPSDTLPFDFVHPRDIKTDAHLVLCGHYHVPFSYQTETCQWLNPGSFCRWSIGEHKQSSSAILIEIDKGIITTKLLPIDVVGIEGFNLETYQQEKQQDRDIQTFVNSLQSTSFTTSNLEDIIKTAAQVNGIDVLIVDEILQRLKKAKDTLL